LFARSRWAPLASWPPRPAPGPTRRPLHRKPHAMTKRKRVGVLISGRGSNLQALINACKTRDYPAEIVLVISNVPQAQGLLRAEAALIPTRTLGHKHFPSREDFGAALDAALKNGGDAILCNAGFMRSQPPGAAESWRARHLTTPPSLLP